MSPPNVLIPKEKVIEAGVEIVRNVGLNGLTARAVAAKLGTSVGPIYRSCESMDQLITAVLESARELLQQYTSRSYTSMPFRNVGVGLVEFARDEPNLYLALFVERHHFRSIILEFCRDMEGSLAADATFQTLAAAAREELLLEMWTYSHGLAMFVISGLVEDTSTEAINQRMGRIGFAVITAAFGGDTRWALTQCPQE